MILYVIRHGHPDYEHDCLTPLGREQAEAVARRLAQLGVDRIYASPMGRARETAQPLCRLLGMEPVIEEWAHEIGDERLTFFPDGVRKSISVVQNTRFLENGNWDRRCSDAFDCPGIDETGMRKAVDFLTENGDAFLERHGYRKENGIYRILQPNEERIALFCHAAMGRAWLSSLLHVPLNIMWASFDYRHTGLTILEFRNNPDGFTAPICRAFADCAHLE